MPKRPSKPRARRPAARSGAEEADVPKEEAPRRKSRKRTRSVVIVESPAKAKTIQKYLGTGYEVLASLGHVIDLPRRKLGIDLEKGFEPTYRPIKDRESVLKQLKAATRGADMVYLCPDPDREGEAIAWHLGEALRIPPEKLRRVVFHEITQQAIRDAFARNPETQRIDTHKVEAQQARRLLDRIVGYMLSPLLQKKIAKGLSAGRVQSVAVRLIVDREREIAAFTPQEYWRILARVAPRGRPQDAFDALLTRIDNAALQTDAKPADRRLGTQAEAHEVAADLPRHAASVIQCVRKPRRDHPPSPLTTSLLQQQAANRFHMTAAHTMRTAQQMYQGVEIPGEGPVGLITYMRTDSVRIAPEALQACRDLIPARFGHRYLNPEVRTFKARRGAQEAHEAIRPTDLARTPESLREVLTREQGRIYQLIWERTVASQMAPAEMESTQIVVEAGPYRLEATGQVTLFDGYRALLKKREEDEPALPRLDAETPLEPLDPSQVRPVQLFTQPPPRFSEASLVRTLEKLGIGRPSTYASIISTIQDRGYVQKTDRRFHATELGTLITDRLVTHFKTIMDVGFTARIEEELDQVESAQIPWRDVLKEFYGPFSESLRDAQERMEDNRTKPTPTGQPCEKCNREMVIKWSRRGRFLACPGFPECRNAKPLVAPGEAPLPIDSPPCEKCGRPMQARTGRFGTFLACTGYPECKQTRPIPTGHKCPKDGCGGDLVERRTKKGGRRFYGCSRYPECDTLIRKLPEPEGAPAREEVADEADA